MKTIRRLLRAFCVVLVASLTTVGVAGYLALQEPGYYAELRSRPPAPQELAAAAANVEAARAAYVHWRGLSHASDPEAPVPEAHEVCFTEADLNALLATESRRVGDGEVRAPQIRVTRDRVDVAIGVTTAAADWVLSADLSPSLDREGALTLAIESVRLGLLPLPCDTIARLFPRERHRLSGSLHLDLTESKPRLVIDLADAARSVWADSISCGDGEVTIRFVARPAAG